jgi:cell division septal protein FtsQ
VSAPRRGLPRAPGVAAPADRRFHRADLGVERRRGFARRRLLRRLAVLLAVLAVVGWAGQVLVESSLLTVRHVEISGNTHLSVLDIEELVAGVREESILRADLEHYRQRVLASPWVAEAAVSRLLPATIKIGIVEREPMAVARHDSQLYLVDERGSIIDDYGPKYRAFELPMIDGLIGRHAGEGIAVDPERAQLTADTLRSLSARRDLVDRLSHIDVSNAHDVVVMFDDDPAWIHLGNVSFVERLARYVELRPTFVERFGALDYVDLRFDPQLYVRGRGREQERRSGSD